MRVLAWLLTWLISSIAFATAWAGTAAAQCERHFHNHSNYYWGVVINGSCNGSSFRCTVPPHATATLSYLAIPGPVGAIGITSPFYANSFPTTGCYIFPSGNTGYVAVNDPVDGDVTTCGDPSLPCPVLRSRKSRAR